MQIFVSLPRGVVTLSLASGRDTKVEALQNEIRNRLGVDPQDLRLVYGGKELQSSFNQGHAHGAALEDYGVQEGSTIELAPRLPGGALLGKDMKGRGKKTEDDKLNRAKEQSEREQRYLAARAELKAKVEREEANSRVNKLKIQNQWRKIMRLAKVESLKKEIEILSQNHERDVDRKDAIIQMLDRDLEESEDQFQMALRKHLANLDRLVDLQDSRLLALEQEFEQELKTIEHEFVAERQAIEKHHAAEVEELKDLIAAVQQDEVDRESDAKQEHEQGREEIKNRNLEEINMLRIQLDSQIEDLEQKFENAHLNYLQTTDQRTSDFKYFTKKDQELSKEIEIKIRKIERLQASLTHWRTKLNQNVKESQARNSLMMEERNKIQGHYQRLKQRMNRFRGGQLSRLATLTKNTTQAKQTLKDNIGLAERIMTLAELAQKMETEHEKITPFYESTPLEGSAEEPEAGAAAAPDAHASVASGLSAASSEAKLLKDAKRQPYQTGAADAEGSEVKKFNQLDLFFKKYNKALLDKLAIDRERERLRLENANLQSMVKQYIDGVSLNDSVLAQPGNPLFVVNGRVNLNRALPVRLDREALSVVDANHMVATNRVNTGAPL